MEFHDAHVEDDLVFDPTVMTAPMTTALVYQVVHTGVFLGIARAALHDATEFVQQKSRLWYESSAERATEDPYTLLRIGEMTTMCHAAELLADRAGGLCDDAVREQTPEVRGLASVGTGEARAFCAKTAMRVSEMLFQVCGTSSVLSKYGFDRHWRNARTLSLHNPLDYKVAHVGDLALNGTLPLVDAYN